MLPRSRLPRPKLRPEPEPKPSTHSDKTVTPAELERLIKGPVGWPFHEGDPTYEEFAQVSSSEDDDVEDVEAEDEKYPSADVYKIVTSLRKVNVKNPEAEKIIHNLEIRNNTIRMDVDKSLMVESTKSDDPAYLCGELKITNTSNFHVLYLVLASSPKKFEIKQSIGWIFPFATTWVKIQTKPRVIKGFPDILHEKLRVFGVPLYLDAYQSNWSQKTLERYWRVLGSELFPTFMVETHDVEFKLSPIATELHYSFMDVFTILNPSFPSPNPKMDFPPMNSNNMDVRRLFTESEATEWTHKTQLVTRHFELFNTKTREIKARKDRNSTIFYGIIFAVLLLIYGIYLALKMVSWSWPWPWPNFEWPDLVKVCASLGLPKFMCPQPPPSSTFLGCLRAFWRCIIGFFGF